MKSVILGNERGSVAVVTAVSLFVLVGVMAFTFDTGYLYLQKNRYQNAVEAAALSGTLSLCEDPEGTALEVLKESLFGGRWPEAAMPEGWVTVGRYDERSGRFWSLAELDDEEYENAVKVTITVDEQNLVPLPPFDGSLTIAVSALAFKEPYGLLACGEPGDEPNIETRDKYPAGSPIFENMGRLHANGDMRFVGDPTIRGDTRASASGMVVNLSAATEGAEMVRDDRPLDWDALRAKAEASGRVFRMSDFPKRNEETPDKNYLEYDGNRCYAVKADGKGFAFGLHAGDHGGAVYYISAEGFLDFPPEEYYISITGINEEQNSRITNFVVASEIPLSFANPMGRHTLGGPGEQMAYIYCKQAIGDSTATLTNFLHGGVIYRTEKDFNARMPWWTSANQATYHMRVIARGAILLYGGRNLNAVRTTLDGGFGPPCGPGILRLAPAVP